MAGIYVSPAGAEDESLSGDTVFLQIEESVTEAVFREVSTAFADKYKPSLLQGVTAGEATVYNLLCRDEISPAAKERDDHMVMRIIPDGGTIPPFCGADTECSRGYSIHP